MTSETLKVRLDGYLALRHSLGYKTSVHQHVLRDFVGLPRDSWPARTYSRGNRIGLGSRGIRSLLPHWCLRPLVDGPRFPPSLEGVRAGDRNPFARTRCQTAPAQGAPVLAGTDQPDDGSRASLVLGARFVSAEDLWHGNRTARQHGVAHRRGASTGAGSGPSRPRPALPGDPRYQVPQVAPGAGSCHHSRQTEGISSGAEAAPPRSYRQHIFHQ